MFSIQKKKITWVSNLVPFGPFSFFISMLVVLITIIIAWLLACSFLLDIPLSLSKPVDSLGFVLGYVWGYFASSWALLALLQPDISHFAGFTRVLVQHFGHAPGLYSLHCLCLMALIYWGISLFNGLIAKTNSCTRAFIKVTFILFVLLLIFSLIFLLFSDVLLAHCAPVNTRSSWFSSWFFETLKPTSSQQIITNSLNILHEAANTNTNTCQSLTDQAFDSLQRGSPRAAELQNKAKLCNELKQVWSHAAHKVSLEFAKSDGGQQPDNLSGFQKAVHSITQEVVQPAAQLVVDSALKGAAKEVFKDVIKAALPVAK